MALLDRAGASLRSLIFPGDYLGEVVVGEVFDWILVLQPRHLRYLRWHERDDSRLYGVWNYLHCEPLPIRGGWSLRFLLALRFLDTQAIEAAAIWDNGFELDVHCAFCERERALGERSEWHPPAREPGTPTTVLRCDQCGMIYCQSCNHCWPARVEPARVAKLNMRYEDWPINRCHCLRGYIYVKKNPAIRPPHPNNCDVELQSISPSTPEFCMPRSRDPRIIEYMKKLGSSQSSSNS